MAPKSDQNSKASQWLSWPHKSASPSISLTPSFTIVSLGILASWLFLTPSPASFPSVLHWPLHLTYSSSDIYKAHSLTSVKPSLAKPVKSFVPPPTKFYSDCKAQPLEECWVSMPNKYLLTKWINETINDTEDLYIHHLIESSKVPSLIYYYPHVTDREAESREINCLA